MYTLYKFHFLNGISEINQLFDDILIIWPAPVHVGHNQLRLPLGGEMWQTSGTSGRVALESFRMAL